MLSNVCTLTERAGIEGARDRTFERGAETNPSLSLGDPMTNAQYR